MDGLMRSATRGFQSTLSVRRATVGHTQIHDGLIISIHALREESDKTGIRPASIHALREESDASSYQQTPEPNGFQSTLSVRRATLYGKDDWPVYIFQSTLSVRRATRGQD